MKPGDTIIFNHYGRSVHGVVKSINEHPGRRNRPTTITAFCPELDNKIELPLDSGYTVIDAISPDFRRTTIILADFTWRGIQARADERNRAALGE